MPVTLTTSRLSLGDLSIADAAFIQELVNTPGWLQFIGNRNVNNIEDAICYIEKILANPNVSYRVARLKDDGTAVGVVTLIQRDYLAYPDIGFAFLPAFTGKGYAFEATETILKGLTQQHPNLFAITIKENDKSIKLLESLGFTFSSSIQNEGETLELFSLGNGITHS